jgi:membrane-associated PAP2 superfamily phosphatase
MTRRFWISHAVLPGAAYVLFMMAIVVVDADRHLANAFFYDPEAGRWIGAHTRWAETWIHTGGRDFVRAIALSAVLALVASYFIERLQPLRREAAFVTLAIVLSTGLVGLLKHLTDVDCPWDLAGYGGANPYVPLFGNRPDFLPAAACFPGAHSSSGFALVCFYFLLRGRLRWATLVAGLAVGGLFAFGQEARGAHFLSHDLTSAALVWGVQLALSRVMLHHGSEPAIDSPLQPRLTT